MNTACGLEITVCYLNWSAVELWFILWGTERHLPMSTAAAKSKDRPVRLPDLDRQVTQAKAVLRALRDTLEDLDDRRELARAKKRNSGKTGANWESIKKEMGFDF